MHDIANNVKFSAAKGSGAVTASGQGSVVDASGFKSVAFGILVGTVTTADSSNYFTFTVQEGDLSDGSDMANIPADRIIGSAVLNASGQANSCLKIGAIPAKRYVRLAWTETGSASAEFGAVAALGNPNHAPAA
jgi:hypothetical protein